MDLEQGNALVGLIRVLGKVQGRKRLQKIVHLLKSKSEKDFQFGFTLHYYGPFSRQVADSLDFLCAVGIVKEGNNGGMYTYQLSGRIQSARKQLVSGEQTRTHWKSFAQKLDTHNTQFLEALSTLVYLFKAGISRNELKNKFKCIKPNLVSYFDEVREFAKENALIT